MKKYLVPLFSFFAVLTLLLTGCGGSAPTTSATPTALPTAVKKTFTVQRGDIVINSNYFGRFTPRALNTVYFQMDGHVADVYARVNDVVKKGELLADLQELKDLQANATTTRDAVRRAQIALQEAQLTLDKYRAGGADSFDVQIQQLQVELAQMDLNEVLAKYNIDPAANALDELDAQVNKAKVFSPADGVVIFGVNPNQAVSPTSVAFKIGDGSQLEIIVDMASADADAQFKSMYEGMPVSVSPNSDPTQKLSGKISMLPSPYGTGDASDLTFHVVLDAAGSTANFKSGDTVTVAVQLANKTGVLWLPPEAIRQLGGRTFVVVNGANGPKRIDIEIGLKTQEKIEILSGLTEGQVVLGQ